MIYSPIWNVENSLSRPQPPGVTLFGKLNHFGPQAKQWLGWPLATAQLNSFWPKVKPVATLCPVTRHKLVIHTRNVKLCVTYQNTPRHEYFDQLKYVPSLFHNLALCTSSLEFLFLFLHSLFRYHIHTSHQPGSFSNLSRGSTAGVAVLRLRFIGFSQMLDHRFLLAIGNHRW